MTIDEPLYLVEFQVTDCEGSLVDLRGGQKLRHCAGQNLKSGILWREQSGTMTESDLTKLSSRPQIYTLL